MKLKATPENEDFGHKYTEEGQGLVGSKLIEGYFQSVKKLLNSSVNLKGRNELTAIEIGCGEGYSTQRIRRFLSEEVNLTASEYVGKLIPKAKELNPGITVIQESVYDLTHDNETFDIVFLLEVLEHLDYPELALEEISRILKKDGTLVLGVPREPIWRGLNMLRGKYIKDFGNTVGHLNHWSTKGIIKFMQKNKWQVKSKATPLPWSLIAAKKHED